MSALGDVAGAGLSPDKGIMIGQLCRYIGDNAKVAAHVTRLIGDNCTAEQVARQRLVQLGGGKSGIKRVRGTPILAKNSPPLLDGTPARFKREALVSQDTAFIQALRAAHHERVAV